MQWPGRSLEEIERVMDRDYFMDVDQAVEFGVIDKILAKRSDVGEEGRRVIEVRMNRILDC